MKRPSAWMQHVMEMLLGLSIIGNRMYICSILDFLCPYFLKCSSKTFNCLFACASVSMLCIFVTLVIDFDGIKKVCP